MNAWVIQPVLAADFGTIVFFFFLVVSFFSWVGKQIKATNENAARQRDRGARIGGAGRPREQPLQNEIDAFLEDVLGHDPRNEAEQQRKKQEQERQRRQQAAAQRERARAQQKAQQKPKRKSSGAGKKKSITSLPDAPLAQGVESHVATYMTSHLDHLETHVDQHVQEHLGSHETGPTTAAKGGSLAAQQLFAILKSPQGMRQAILLNEIFSKPKSQR